MSKEPLSYVPGVCKIDSPYSDSIQSGGVDGRPASGRFTDMNNARFVGGYPEKIGGSTLLYTSALTGVPRGVKDWRDNQQNIYLGIGTSSHLYYISQDTLNNITPLRAILAGTLTDVLSTSSGSDIVNVNDTAHGLQTNDTAILSAAAAIGGITVSGVYHITFVDADNYTIIVSSAATSTVSGAGGVLTYTYYRITLTNPFATVSGSTTVTVTHTAHGAVPNDYVDYSGATAVGGLTISGEYQILTTTTNTYTITAASAATSTASGGGSVSTIYEISGGSVDSFFTFGYGVGGYGLNGYGTMATASAGLLLQARTWSLAKYGQQLLANPYGGSIYVYDPTVGGRAYQLYNAPPAIYGMFVTPERFVIALGGVGGIPMQLAWPDQNDYTDWTSLPTNTANSGRTLQEGSFLVTGTPVRDGVSLIFSNTSCYAFLYIGDNNIYSSTVSGTKCGLIGPLAVCVYAGKAFWMSSSDLWAWDGGVQNLPTDDIRDYIFKDINITQAAKFAVGGNSAKKEIWFFYCSANSTENDRYVIYHVDQNCFSIGQKQRTSWIDKDLWGYPISADASGFMYYQESGHDDNGVALDSYITLSPVDISKGDMAMDIFSFIPDFQRLIGTSTFSFLTKDYPQDTTSIDGPHTIADDGSTAIIDDLRVNGRLVGFTFENNVLGGDWRLGLPRVEVQPAGARR